MGNKCAGLRHDGEPCGFAVISDGDFCRNHQDQAPSPNPLQAPETAAPELIEDAPEMTPYEVRQAAARKEAMQRRATVRARRKGLGGYDGQKLVAAQREGYHRHWMNDDGPNLKDMLDKGYSFVEDETASIESDDLGRRKSQQVSKSGPPMRAYLMEIPEKDYQTDQDDKERKVRESEDSIRQADGGGAIGEKTESGDSVLYDPEDGRNQLLT